MQESIGKGGTAAIAVITAAVVAGSVWLAFGRDDTRSTPLEDVAAGRAIAPSPQATTAPQGRDAPDSREGVDGAGTETQTRGLTDPETNPNAQAEIGSGRNAPQTTPNAAAQRVPRNDLESGANADPEESARIPR
jgi:hypothetical protein